MYGKKRIEKGCVIVLDKRSGRVFIKSPDTIKTLRWSRWIKNRFNMENNSLHIPFVKTDQDFWLFACVLADTHNLRLRHLKKWRLYGPAYKFI